MPDGMRQFGVGVLVVALMAWAHGPSLSAGVFGGDLELLAGLKGRGPLVLFGVPGTGGRPLAGLSLFIDRGSDYAYLKAPGDLSLKVKELGTERTT